MDQTEIKLKVGPVFMTGIPETVLDTATEELIADYNIGGVILFARNVEDPIQVGRLCRDLQECAIEHHGLPLILAVDQEGGRVARLREPFTLFPGNSAIGKDRDPVGKAVEFGQVTAHELKLVGLNMDFAPVVDVQRGEIDEHLKDRTFSDDPGQVADLGKAVVKTLQENGVMAVAKHFPGLGKATMDPHIHLPRIDTGVEEIESINLVPFRAAIEGRVKGIMTSHAIYPALDNDIPGTLSRKVLEGLLREELNFKGLIITDDLEMGAIEKKWGVAEGAILAFEAGADLLLICNNQENLRNSLSLFCERVKKGNISLGRLDQSSRRVVKLREQLKEDYTDVSIDAVREYFKL